VIGIILSIFGSDLVAALSRLGFAQSVLPGGLDRLPLAVGVLLLPGAVWEESRTLQGEDWCSPDTRPSPIDSARRNHVGPLAGMAATAGWSASFLP